MDHDPDDPLAPPASGNRGLRESGLTSLMDEVLGELPPTLANSAQLHLQQSFDELRRSGVKANQLKPLNTDQLRQVTKLPIGLNQRVKKKLDSSGDLGEFGTRTITAPEKVAVDAPDLVKLAPLWAEYLKGLPAEEKSMMKDTATFAANLKKTSPDLDLPKKLHSVKMEDLCKPDNFAALPKGVQDMVVRCSQAVQVTKTVGRVGVAIGDKDDLGKAAPKAPAQKSRALVQANWRKAAEYLHGKLRDPNLINGALKLQKYNVAGEENFAVCLAVPNGSRKFCSYLGVRVMSTLDKTTTLHFSCSAYANEHPDGYIEEIPLDIFLEHYLKSWNRSDNINTDDVKHISVYLYGSPDRGPRTELWLFMCACFMQEKWLARRGEIPAVCPRGALHASHPPNPPYDLNTMWPNNEDTMTKEAAWIKAKEIAETYYDKYKMIGFFGTSKNCEDVANEVFLGKRKFLPQICYADEIEIKIPTNVFCDELAASAAALGPSFGDQPLAGVKDMKGSMAIFGAMGAASQAVGTGSKAIRNFCSSAAPPVRWDKVQVELSKGDVEPKIPKVQNPAAHFSAFGDDAAYKTAYGQLDALLQKPPQEITPEAWQTNYRQLHGVFTDKAREIEDAVQKKTYVEKASEVQFLVYKQYLEKFGLLKKNPIATIDALFQGDPETAQAHVNVLLGYLMNKGFWTHKNLWFVDVGNHSYAPTVRALMHVWAKFNQNIKPSRDFVQFSNMILSVAFVGLAEDCKAVLSEMEWAYLGGDVQRTEADMEGGVKAITQQELGPNYDAKVDLACNIWIVMYRMKLLGVGNPQSVCACLAESVRSKNDVFLVQQLAAFNPLWEDIAACLDGKLKFEYMVQIQSNATFSALRKVRGEQDLLLEELGQLYLQCACLHVEFAKASSDNLPMYGYALDEFFHAFSLMRSLNGDSPQNANIGHCVLPQVVNDTFREAFNYVIKDAKSPKKEEFERQLQALSFAVEGDDFPKDHKFSQDDLDTMACSTVYLREVTRETDRLIAPHEESVGCMKLCTSKEKAVRKLKTLLSVIHTASHCGISYFAATAGHEKKLFENERWERISEGATTVFIGIELLLMWGQYNISKKRIKAYQTAHMPVHALETRRKLHTFIYEAQASMLGGILHLVHLLSTDKDTLNVIGRSTQALSFILQAYAIWHVFKEMHEYQERLTRVSALAVIVANAKDQSQPPNATITKVRAWTEPKCLQALELFVQTETAFLATKINIQRTRLAVGVAAAVGSGTLGVLLAVGVITAATAGIFGLIISGVSAVAGIVLMIWSFRTSRAPEEVKALLFDRVVSPANEFVIPAMVPENAVKEVLLGLLKALREGDTAYQSKYSAIYDDWH